VCCVPCAALIAPHFAWYGVRGAFRGRGNEVANLLWVAIALPLAGCLALAFAGGRLAPRAVAIVGCGTVFAAFALVVLAWGDLLTLPESARVRTSAGWRWLDAGTVSVAARLVFDPLAAALALIVTGIGGLIHVYAAGYMRGDPGYARFFALLNGFIAAMLLLTFAGSVPLLAVGWIGVGIASALLIAFWHDRPGTVAAGRKAFIVNMVGDVGLLAAMAVFADRLGTLDMGTINATAPQLSREAAVVAAVGLLLAAGAKSAQLPLSGWLPDAMAGPTPVSALIHAATMVAAGIYLLIRLFPVLDRSGLLGLIAVIGALTALYGGACALAQPNLKRVLAYSTVSQLGLMVFAIGMGATAVAAFHLATHAAFKAVLFLAAGSVIHALDGEEEMSRMGGLLRRLPGTAVAFGIGALALGGFPGLSGFFSKDAIAEIARERGPLPYLAALAISALTAAYATRAFVRTFLGPTHPAHPHVHAPGPEMTVPQGVLAALAVVAGYLPIQAFLLPRLGGEEAHLTLAGAAISTLVALAAAAATWFLLQRRRDVAAESPATRFLRGGLGLDNLVDALFVAPALALAEFAQGGDRGGTAQGGGGDTPGPPNAFAAFRHANLHRHVLGVAAGAFAVAVLLLLRG